MGYIAQDLAFLRACEQLNGRDKMGIETVERFHCPRCGFVTENKEGIEWIKKLGGKCPTCDDGEIKTWGYTHKEGL